MFQIERLQKIKQILLQEKSVSVIELSENMNVSEITIRRDFEKLEQDGFLTRTHGGAILNSHTGGVPEQTFFEEKTPLSFNISERSAALGSICCNIVDDYDVVFLTKCPSNLALVHNLKEKTDVVVITNYLDIVSVMAKNKKNKVILIGGEVDYDRMTTRRGSFESSENHLKMGKAFVHVQGIDFDNGITVNDYEDKIMYDQLKQSAAEIIIVIEGVLFGKTGLIKIDDISNITTLVTDDNIPDDYKIIFFRKGVKLYQKFDLT